MRSLSTAGGALRAVVTCAALLAISSAPAIGVSPTQNADSSSKAASEAPGVPFSADKLAKLLPATVYFEGQSAPLQLRNAAGTTFGENAILWASLVDTSGYSTGVQERYQFYLVTEAGLRFGDVRVAPGAYGAGFVKDRFLLMDLGGHVVGEGPTEVDAALRRPRPLQMLADQPTSVKLYLGKRWVLLKADHE